MLMSLMLMALLPWVKVAPSLSKSIRCGVCDYLRHQIDICPREHSEYLNALVQRLGSHSDMQSAQRLAQDKLPKNATNLEAVPG